LNANTIIVTTATLQDSDKPTEIQQAALDVLLSNFLDLLLSDWTMYNVYHNQPSRFFASVIAGAIHVIPYHALFLHSGPYQ